MVSAFDPHRNSSARRASRRPRAARAMGGLARALALAPLLALLGGCNWVVMQPSGDIALQQRNLVLASTGLMLLIIVPVIGLTLFFAWRYRESNREATYDPEWNHSTQLEVVIWTAPLVIIIALGALTWISTHTLDPFRPLSRIDSGRPIQAGTEPLQVEAVALDWKWLFFYPQYGIATVNELAAPVDRPITFKITAASVMNAFYVPALAGMIYAMPGMETKLHAVINKAGEYDGLSSHYSGGGFSKMTFKFHGLAPEGFDKWIEKAKAEGKPLTREGYLELERPSEGDPVRYYVSVADGLYSSILNMCALPGKMCMNEMMRIDAAGGAGKESQENHERLQYDNRHVRQGHEAPAATVPATGRAPRSEDPKAGASGDGKAAPGNAVDDGSIAPAQRTH